MSTLSQQLTTFRGTQVPAGHQGLMSILSIDGRLYDIKDPAVEYLAEQIESRLNSIEHSNIRETALAKDQNAPKFATSVTQGVDGQISVTYSDAAATDITFGEINWTATNVKAAILEALSKAIGTNADTSSDDTINGVRAYVDSVVENLAGTNWEQNAKKVQEIIAEIENSENANGWTTAIDKLAGLGVYYTQAEADAHNATLTGALTSETTLTAEQATALNTVLGTETYAADQQPSEADANTYNATLTGAWTTSTIKTPQTVKQYVDGKVTDLTTAIVTNEQVTAAALVDLNTGKANKAAITTGTINNYVISYSGETLTFTNTETSVYVPVSGETL